MIKFFFFSSIAHLYLIMSSSVMTQYGDIKQKQYNDFGLIRAFRKYLTISTEEIYVRFMTYAIGYYNQPPIDCIKLMERHQGNCVFKV